MASAFGQHILFYRHTAKCSTAVSMSYLCFYRSNGHQKRRHLCVGHHLHKVADRRSRDSHGAPHRNEERAAAARGRLRGAPRSRDLSPECQLLEGALSHCVSSEVFIRVKINFVDLYTLSMSVYRGIHLRNALLLREGGSGVPIDRAKYLQSFVLRKLLSSLNTNTV